jgi:toxin CcdB
MAQFDIYRFASRGNGPPFLVDLQSDLLDGLATRIVAPLYPKRKGDKPILRLNPQVKLDGKSYYLAIQEMSAIRVKSFGETVGSLQHQRAEIVAAIDLLITGV